MPFEQIKASNIQNKIVWPKVRLIGVLIFVQKANEIDSSLRFANNLRLLDKEVHLQIVAEESKLFIDRHPLILDKNDFHKGKKLKDPNTFFVNQKFDILFCGSPNPSDYIVNLASTTYSKWKIYNHPSAIEHFDFVVRSNRHDIFKTLNEELDLILKLANVSLPIALEA